MNSDIKTVDEYIEKQLDWQTTNLQAFRKIIHESSNDITEEIKWGVPAFVYNSKVTFTMASFKSHTKYNFISNGALLNDSHKLFNNGLESAKSRSIDLTENQTIDTAALKELVSQSISKLP